MAKIDKLLKNKEKKYYHFKYDFRMANGALIYFKCKVKIKRKNRNDFSLRDAEYYALQQKVTLYKRKRKKLIPIKTTYNHIKEEAVEIRSVIFKK